MLALIGITFSIVLFAFLGLAFNIFMSRKTYSLLRIAPTKYIKHVGIQYSNFRNEGNVEKKSSLKEAKLDITKM